MCAEWRRQALEEWDCTFLSVPAAEEFEHSPEEGLIWAGHARFAISVVSVLRIRRQHSVDRLSAHGFRVYRRSVYDIAGELKGGFDLVFLTSVVEHLLEPPIIKVQYCRACRRESTEGKAEMAVPNPVVVLT